MTELWQNPGGEVLWFREVYGPDARASYCWRGPDLIEIRIWRKRKETKDNYGKGWLWQEWLDPYGQWHEIEEAQWCFPSKLITKEEALRMQIKELEPNVHILSYDMDLCAACRIPGYVHNTLQTECPGWIE